MERMPSSKRAIAVSVSSLRENRWSAGLDGRRLPYSVLTENPVLSNCRHSFTPHSTPPEPSPGDKLQPAIHLPPEQMAQLSDLAKQLAEGMQFERVSPVQIV